MFDEFVSFIREVYNTNDFIPLHEPRFVGNEKEYLLKAIDSTYVSSIGEHIADFETAVADFTGATFAIATVNGSAALHSALILAGVKNNEEVITQSLTFVATCNAIKYCNAEPVFVDVDKESLSLSPESLLEFLEDFCELRNDGYCWNKSTNRLVRVCMPMHTFGFPACLKEIQKICEKYNITLIEDAAAALGSRYEEKHTGRFGRLGVISFNGNKVITSGGGGIILTDDEKLAIRAKHITTTAKLSHRWAFSHDEIGYNYRLPNINAVLGLAQMELLPAFLKKKRELASNYQSWGKSKGLQFICEQANTEANYWLNSVVTEDQKQRDALLEYTNNNNVMTRSAWTPMHKLSMYHSCMKSELNNTEWLHERLVSVPSSVPGFNLN